MIKYIIPIIIVLIVIIAVIFVFRNKHLTEMKRLQALKDKLQMKPVQDELAKVKGLNMNGQTEEMFESWKNKWENLNDQEFPKIDALIDELRGHIDRFQFGKASIAEKEIDARIADADKTIIQILDELDYLVNSEKQSSIEIEQLHEQYRTSRKTLLAHQYSFGDAARPLEERLELFNPQFEDYHQLTEAGDYLKAREIVEHLNREGQEIFKLISTIPGLLREIQKQIPSDLQELRYGHNELVDTGFYLRHLEIPEWIRDIEGELIELKDKVAELEIGTAELRVQEIREDIDHYFDALEAEYNSKKYVDQSVAPIGTRLHEVLKYTMDTAKETEEVQKSYQIPQNEAAIPVNCKQELTSIQQRYETIVHELELHQAAYSMVEVELKEIANDVERIFEEQDAFSDRLKNLRLDENSAADRLKKYTAKLRDTERRLHKANIPGIPDDIDARLSEAEEQLFIAHNKLKAIPLDMPDVFEAVKTAEIAVNETTKHVDSMIEDVKLVELLIQYGNRYRMTKPGMDESLTEAEDAFNNKRYTKALEIAAKAVENVEPGTIVKLEEIVNETLGKA
ncbi:septation ring formation regulator EzrA [Kurthia massiliensis]|uniref:septation ring formation regulator EzrA n=1 Tax=Kurthia massiliensis TaxID=1033739 RepID=UPI000289165C|nr:septation ring formation regulator EzrA [Kurthia massiliensis]